MVTKTIPLDVKRAIDAYVRVLQADQLPIEQVILFGSYAKGKQNKYSDVDICVISPRFEDRFEAIRYLIGKRPDTEPYFIEAIGMTSADLAERTTLAREIRDTGVRVQ
jgi:predicted nucleotidyltransferase